MKASLLFLVLVLIAGSAVAQERPWQTISDPTAAGLAAAFLAPPPEYSAQFDCGFSDSRTRETIGLLLDRAKAVNVQAAFIEPTHGKSQYLSPDYFEAVKVLVEEAKKRNMRLWFDDDGGYPSGFAGGKFTVEHPELRSMALTSQRAPVTAGQQYTDKLTPQTICVLAVNTDTGAAQVLDSTSGSVNWTVPAGNWEIVQPRWAFRSGPTRSANNSNGQKNAEHSLMDYLNPEANKLFDQWTFDAYKNALGDELGKTVLGFRGDEPSFGFNPWSQVLLDEFQKRKGYDLRPYLASSAFGGGGRAGGGRGGAVPATTNLDDGHRAFADYCDVWSDLFGENFFGGEGRWCAENHVEMQMHIEHEENLPQLATSNGDFFKCMRGIQVPGIDTIWHQTWHDVVSDFPKLASSATHLNGRPRAMCEAFAAYNPIPDIKEAGWILNHLMVNGISRIEYMGLQGTGAYRNFYADPTFPTLSSHVNRLSYLLGEGRPVAQIGVYIPTTSFWLKDTSADTSFVALVHQLLQHQRDLDYVDEYALSKTLKLQGRELINLSGQAYRAILVPPVDAMSRAALDHLRAFASAGGKVIFFGGAPKLVTDKNFLTATGPADISWATLVQAKPEITDQVLASLPAPDVMTDQPTSWLKYNHRRMKDADVYFFFNEGEQPLSLKATVTARDSARQVEHWDTASGKIEPWTGATAANGKTTLALELPVWGTSVVVIRD